jgi:RNA polymerase sigma factor (sigma-70 family)
MAAAAASTEAREDELVASAQAGNREAFEALFRRYRDRITTFVRASVRDDGRAEDVVQEVFISAHRSLRSLEHPGAFRSWLYQIARNACLDEARRRSRQDELVFGWEEFPPPDERIASHSQGADASLSQKEEFTNLTQALDGLPESQHDALVLREIGGMSYDEIGRRMRLSRPAVESVLFRARRGLKGEFSEIATGERCKRMQVVMSRVAGGAGDLGERRKLIRHMRDCPNCRRDASALGLAGLAVPSDERHGLQRALSRVAALMPLPAFFRRAEDGEQLSGTGSVAAQAQGAASQLSTAVGSVGGDHAASVIHKAAAVVAAVAVVGGGTAAIEKAGVKLPVNLPGVHSAKSHKQAPAGTPAAVNAAPGTAGSTGQGAGAKQPPLPPALGGSDAHGGLLPGTTSAPAGQTPAGTGSPAAGSPTDPAATTPGTGTPGVTAPTTTPGSPGTGGKKTGGSTTGSGGAPTGSGTTGTTTTPAVTPTGQTIPAGTPPGVQRQLQSGKKTLEELPPGLKKKLAAGSTTVTTPQTVVTP